MCGESSYSLDATLLDLVEQGLVADVHDLGGPAADPQDNGCSCWRMTTRLIMFSSSRMLPGHSYSMNSWRSCSLRGRAVRLYLRAYRAMKKSMRVGISSGRSRRGGTVSSITFNR